MATKNASKKTTTTKKPAPKSASTEKARKAAIAEIDQRLAGGKQDHELPTAKETANDAANAAYAASKAPKATTPRKPAKDVARANVAAHVGGHKRPSALDLAAKAVAESKEPMSAKSLAERAMAEGWKTSGRTPEATIYSAIIREIKAKGPASRFAKASRGLFTAGKA